MRAPFTCPHCGADVPPKAKSCPECGSDETTGWSEEANVGGLDLPEENFDYEQFVAREFGSDKSSPSGLSWFWWVVAVFVLAALVWLWIR